MPTDPTPPKNDRPFDDVIKRAKEESLDEAFVPAPSDAYRKWDQESDNEVSESNDVEIHKAFAWLCYKWYGTDSRAKRDLMIRLEFVKLREEVEEAGRVCLTHWKNYPADQALAFLEEDADLWKQYKLYDKMRKYLVDYAGVD